jgi:hypothetical protein
MRNRRKIGFGMSLGNPCYRVHWAEWDDAVGKLQNDRLSTAESRKKADPGSSERFVVE